MFRINKTAELLEVIATKNVVTFSELVDHKTLPQIFVTSGRGVPRRRIIDTLALLVKQGSISVGQIDGEKIYKLSARGRKQLQSYLIIKQGVPRPSRWDKQWYLVTFDIPERQKTARNALITHLKQQRFFNYAKGIWILPYNPSKYLDDLAAYLGLSGQIKLIVANKVSDEIKLKRHFRVS